MTTQNVKGFAGLRRALARDLPKVRKRVIKASAKAAIATAHEVAQNIPIAFGELRASVHVDTTGSPDGRVSTVADAPHAAAVEAGSRPHWVPLQPLIDWVKLRGAQGIRRGGRLAGTTSRAHATRVASELRALEKTGHTAGDHSDINAPVSIARAIQLAIAKRGTRPHFYMRARVPFARQALDAAIRTELGRE